MGVPIRKALTNAHVRRLEPREKQFKFVDGLGLYVLVKPNGSKLWRFDYKFEGAYKTLAFGQFPDVGIEDARGALADARKALARGEDPSALRKAAKAPPKRPPPPPKADESFGQLANRWYMLRSPAWEPAYADRVWSRVKGDVIPVIGHVAVSEVTPDDVLRALQRVTGRGSHEMARRVRGYVEDIFEVARATRRDLLNPAAGLTKALPAPHPVKRRAFLKPSELPGFFGRLDAYEGSEMVRLALQFTLLTALRTDEVRFAHDRELEQINGREPLVRLSPERMKMTEGRGEHLVPLSRQAVTVVRRLQEIRPAGADGFLFHAERGERQTRTGIISNMAMLSGLYRMGFQGRATVHGFRSTFSTWANEQVRNGVRRFDRDWIETQLAHVDKDEVRAIYNSAEYLPGRRLMMQGWADFLDSQAEVGRLL